jgi:hypothetical protein
MYFPYSFSFQSQTYTLSLRGCYNIDVFHIRFDLISLLNYLS